MTTNTLIALYIKQGDLRRIKCKKAVVSYVCENLNDIYDIMNSANAEYICECFVSSGCGYVSSFLNAALAAAFNRCNVNMLQCLNKYFDIQIQESYLINVVKANNLNILRMFPIPQISYGLLEMAKSREAMLLLLPHVKFDDDAKFKFLCRHNLIYPQVTIDIVRRNLADLHFINIAMFKKLVDHITMKDIKDSRLMQSAFEHGNKQLFKYLCEISINGEYMTILDLELINDEYVVNLCKNFKKYNSIEDIGTLCDALMHYTRHNIF